MQDSVGVRFKLFWLSDLHDGQQSTLGLFVTTVARTRTKAHGAALGRSQIIPRAERAKDAEKDNNDS